MRVSAIVLAAGRGQRFRSRIPKPLVKINGKPIIIYSLEALSRDPRIKEIILVINAFNQKAIVRKVREYGSKKIRRIVFGGKERSDSVRNTLKYIGEDADLVLIHDAARPFITKKDISAVISSAAKTGAAILAVPVKATIKSVVSRMSPACRTGRCVVSKTLNRDELWEIQTPQVFKKDLILKAYKKFARTQATDDAMLVEKLGAKVNIVAGSYNNIKITTPEDLILAEAIVKRWHTK